jgi:hypothetical protein
MLLGSNRMKLPQYNQFYLTKEENTKVKIVETYSHLNGLEFLLVHKPKLWKEVQNVIKMIDAEACKTKVSKEKTMKGKLLYSPIDMNKSFKEKLENLQWNESRVSYWVTKDEKLIRKGALPFSGSIISDGERRASH